MDLWRNRLARSAVNRKVGGSSPPRSATFCFNDQFCHFDKMIIRSMEDPGIDPGASRMLSERSTI